MERLSVSPTNPEFVQDPYWFYRQARATGDFFFWEDYNLPMAVSHAAVNAVLRDRRMGREIPAERRVEPPPHLAPFYRIDDNSMLEVEPPRHTRLRSLVLRAFTSRRIQALAPDISELCGQCIDRFPDGRFDLLPALAHEVPVRVIARLLGVPESMSGQLLAWSNAMVAMYQARRDAGIEAAASAAATEFSAFVADYVEIRRKQPGDDLITQLIAAEEDGEKLTQDELIATCILLLNAGHEATVHSIGNAVRTILTTGMAMEALEPEAVEGTIEELLRFDPPLHLFTRWVYEPVELMGQRFERGDQIGCLLAAANRDTAVWAEPETFDPARPVSTNLSFGAGIHFCVGAPLARLELQIVLPMLFARCPGLRLTETPRYADIFHFHGLESLTVDCTG